MNIIKAVHTKIDTIQVELDIEDAQDIVAALAPERIGFEIYSELVDFLLEGEAFVPASPGELKELRDDK